MRTGRAWRLPKKGKATIEHTGRGGGIPKGNPEEEGGFLLPEG